MRTTTDREPNRVFTRLAWFIGLWLAGVTTLAAVVAAIRLLLPAP